MKGGGGRKNFFFHILWNVYLKLLQYHSVPTDIMGTCFKSQRDN